MAEKEVIDHEPIELQWSEWFSWDIVKRDARKDGIKIPNKVSGVYEAKYLDENERLTIGKASDLRFRVRQGLVKGKTSHSAGENIRVKEDISKIMVRWTVTDRPACAEEELHRRHRGKFGKLPKYVERAR